MPRWEIGRTILPEFLGVIPGPAHFEMRLQKCSPIRSPTYIGCVRHVNGHNHRSQSELGIFPVFATKSCRVASCHSVSYQCPCGTFESRQNSWSRSYNKFQTRGLSLTLSLSSSWVRMNGRFNVIVFFITFRGNGDRHLPRGWRIELGISYILRIEPFSVARRSGFRRSRYVCCCWARKYIQSKEWAKSL